MRALFFGTPEIAVPSLIALSEVAEVVGVVCQPDRPAGRGLVPKAPPVKEHALSRGFPVYQPEKVRTGELERWARALEADLALVIAYGRILTSGVLSATRLGSVNLHASLLPRYRGAAPIQRVIMAGEKETGVCLMQMDEGMDTGPVLATHRLTIGEKETAGELALRLGALAAEITRSDLPRFARGELTPHSQDHALATYAPPIASADAILDFRRPAEDLVWQIRGLSPRPGASTTLPQSGRKRLRVLLAKPWAGTHSLPVGTVRVEGSAVLVATGNGTWLELLEAQVEGKRALPALDLVNGRALSTGMHLGESHQDPL